MKYSQEQTETARAQLTRLLPPGATVTCVLRHVSKSGMSRVISLAVPDPSNPGEISDISWAAAVLTESSRCPKTGGIKIGGTGMDMGFAIVYDLAWKLHGRPESNGEGANSLRHRWM